QARRGRGGTDARGVTAVTPDAGSAGGQQRPDDVGGAAIDHVEDLLHAPLAPGLRMLHGPLFLDLGAIEIAALAVVPDLVADFPDLVGHVEGEVDEAAL